MSMASRQQTRLWWIAMIVSLSVVGGCSRSPRSPAPSADPPAELPVPHVDAARPQPHTGSDASPIALENMLDGVSHEDPDKPATTNQVTGYSSAVSAAPGSTIQLFVNVDHDQNVRWDLYRVGYYGGAGMRRVAQGEARPVSVQPDCPIDAGSGKIECDWAPVFDVAIAPEWVSGYYVFELINDDGYGARVPFVIREGARRAAALAQASVTTWQAYNRWGGVSLYANDRKDGPYKGSSAHVVSFERPYQGQNEYMPFLALVRFLEQRGYDISYTTNIDIDADPSALTGRALFMTLAHDEYWTVAERDALEAARDQGVSLAFLSANTGYWRIRLSGSAHGTPRRTITCYKSSDLDPQKNTPDTTEMFREEPFARPENALLGVGYKTWSKVPGYPYIVTNADHWVYSGTGVKTFDALNTVVGSEWDGITDNGKTPSGIEVLARAITIDNDGSFIEGEANVTVYYPTPGSLVFAAGSIYWGYGVGPGRFSDPRIERMVENVLARAGLRSSLPLTVPAVTPPPSDAFESRVLAGDGMVMQKDGPALQASFVAPTGMAAAPDGKLYIVDRGDCVIRVLSPDGMVGCMLRKDSGDFSRPMGLALDSHGNLYLSDSRKHRIFKVTPDGALSTFAGQGSAGAEDATDPLQAKLNAPRGLAMGPNDVLYVADNMNNAIRRIDSTGVKTVATDLRYVVAVAAAASGEVYFSTIIKGQVGVVKNGEVTMLANVDGEPGNREGPAAQARLQPQEGLLLDGDRLLIADTENNRVRALSLTGAPMVRTVYGDGNAAPDASNSRHTWLPRSIVRFNGGYAVSDFGSRRILWFSDASQGM